MNKKIKVNIKQENNSYSIYIGSNWIDKIGSCTDISWKDQDVFILTHVRLADLYLKKVKSSLEKAGAQVYHYNVAEGETSKDLSSLQKIYSKMIHLRLDRKAVLIALGGGVIGDLGGFIAATYLRGIRFIQIPTTLLAQVDASVGGKVAVNLPDGKNLVGAFHQPRAVYIDINFLKTLDLRQWLSGMAEVVKYGMIWNVKFLKFLEDVFMKPECHEQDLIHIVYESCKIKAEVVSKDEKESDLRRILNFGHTFAHGIETYTKYVRWTHGEAVAMGMVAACKLAEKVDGLAPSVRIRLEKLLKKIGLPVSLPKMHKEKYYQMLFADKKMMAGHLIFVLPKKIGHVYCTDKVTKEDILSLL